MLTSFKWQLQKTKKNYENPGHLWQKRKHRTLNNIENTQSISQMLFWNLLNMHNHQKKKEEKWNPRNEKRKTNGPIVIIQTVRESKALENWGWEQGQFQKWENIGGCETRNRRGGWNMRGMRQNRIMALMQRGVWRRKWELQNLDDAFCRRNWKRKRQRKRFDVEFVPLKGFLKMLCKGRTMKSPKNKM